MNSFRQYMSWMHTWTGLVFGWVLFFMFLTGSASYYDTEIDRWMQPEQPAPVIIDDTAALLQVGLDHAMAEAPAADQHFVRIPTSRSYSPTFSHPGMGSMKMESATLGVRICWPMDLLFRKVVILAADRRSIVCTGLFITSRRQSVS